MSLSTAATDRFFFPGRRSILRVAGAFSILSCCRLNGLVWWRTGIPVPTNSVMDILSHYVAAAAERFLPSDVQEQVKFHVLDTFAAMISGSPLQPNRAAARFLAAVASRLLCFRIRVASTCNDMEKSSCI